MKKVLLTVFIAVIAVLAGNAQEIGGKWKTSMESPQGSMKLTFVFKVDGAKLTGTVTSPMGDIEISNGKVNGKEFSFDIDVMGNTMPHKGKLEGEVIKLKVEMPDGGQGGPGGPGEMTLKKANE